MAAAALLSLHFLITFIVCWICLVSAKDKGQFIYEDFNEATLHMDGCARIHQNGLLQLTNTSNFQVGHAFYPSPIKFNTSSSQSLSFSTNFVFSINPVVHNFGGHGMAFVIAPSMDFSRAITSAYLGLFNATNNGPSTNHILAVELDTVQTPEFQDINSNHVGIDVNGLISNDSATATYFSDTEGKNKSLDLSSGNAIERTIWSLIKPSHDNSDSGAEDDGLVMLVNGNISGITSMNYVSSSVNTPADVQASGGGLEAKVVLSKQDTLIDAEEGLEEARNVLPGHDRSIKSKGRKKNHSVKRHCMLMRRSKALALDINQDFGKEIIVPKMQKVSWNLKRRVS
ncbi:hypothetical protein Dsin_020328 [Dipteronia sinensis]|uniref:Legume lectin domain-containing protein n=1 Tax=Dipteronia sinensis TaxID=43782 RepID=A0AAE0A905_9ROSI|nr:hypothetical protein Dsin_020328 [Dipteronia sinensis]